MWRDEESNFHFSNTAKILSNIISAVQISGGSFMHKTQILGKREMNHKAISTELFLLLTM